MKEQYSSDDLKAMKDKIDQRTADIAKDEQAIEDLEDQLRQSGGDPGWARDDEENSDQGPAASPSDDNAPAAQPSPRNRPQRRIKARSRLRKIKDRSRSSSHPKRHLRRRNLKWRPQAISHDAYNRNRTAAGRAKFFSAQSGWKERDGTASARRRQS